MEKRMFLFPWIYLFCSAWLATGAYVDGWAHNHIPELETFFTPWHAILYFGYLASVIVLFVWIFFRRTNGFRGLQMIPEGLEFSLAGMLIFFFAGLGDMLWHIAFGIEAGIEALLSPTHLLLATGVFLMAGGGAKHWIHLHTIHPKTWTHFPLALSVTFALMVLTYMTQFARFTQIISDPTQNVHEQIFGQATAVLGALLLSIILISGLLYLLRHKALRPGITTLVFTLLISSLAFMREGRELIPAAIIAGLIGDLALLCCPSTRPASSCHGELDEPSRRGWTPIWQLHLWCFGLPFFYYALVILTLNLIKDVWWGVHMQAGLPVITGLTGLLTILIVLPDRKTLL